MKQGWRRCLQTLARVQLRAWSKIPKKRPGGVVPAQDSNGGGVVPAQGSRGSGGSDNVVPAETIAAETSVKMKKEVTNEVKKEVKKEPLSPKSPSSLVTGKSKRSLQVFQTMKQLAAKSKAVPKAKELKQRQWGFGPK